MFCQKSRWLYLHKFLSGLLFCSVDVYPYPINRKFFYFCEDWYWILMCLYWICKLLLVEQHLLASSYVFFLGCSEVSIAELSRFLGQVYPRVGVDCGPSERHWHCCPAVFPSLFPASLEVGYWFLGVHFAPCHFAESADDYSSKRFSVSEIRVSLCNPGWSEARDPDQVDFRLRVTYLCWN